MVNRELAGVGAVIVTHSRLDLAVAAATDAVAVLGDPRRVVVVVNLAEHAAAVDVPGIAVVVNEVPAGYGTNLNRGERALPPSVQAVALLNDDVRLGREALGRLVAALDDPEVALAGPAIVGPDGSHQESAFRFPTLASELADALLGPPALSHRLRLWLGRRGGAPAEWVQGAALLVRRRAFREVGGFDEAFHLYFEEVDLALRLTAAGWRVAHVAEAVVEHNAHSTLGGDWLASFGESRARFVRKHWSRRDRLALRAMLPLVYACNALAVGISVVLGQDPAGARRAALRSLVARRPRWSVRPGGATAPPPP